MGGQEAELVLPKLLELQEKLQRGYADFFPEDFDGY